MLRGMIFMDHMNFDIALQAYYKTLSKPTPKLDYNNFFKCVVSVLPNIDFLKAFIFAPKPDNFLMQDKNLASYYKWVSGFANAKYTDVVEGRYIARPTDENIPMDIGTRSTYYKVEKGTDINLAIHALSKAYYNSYDIAFIMSGDTDYISLYKQLKSIGKIVVVVALYGQQLGKVIPEVDDFIILKEDFFNNCLRK
jgi:uncharacterized LabA/DUF88 family protein